MKQSNALIALLVEDYDEAIRFFTQILDFKLLQDIYQPEQNERWVTVSPPNSNGTSLLPAKASKPGENFFIGNQSSGRVFCFFRLMTFGETIRILSLRAWNLQGSP